MDMAFPICGKPMKAQNDRMESITLQDLNTLVRRSIEKCLPDDYWVTAELSDVRENGGHCYLEFLQKDERGNRLIAKARGIIWNSTYNLLKQDFEQATGQQFTSGIKVLVNVSVSFHELYGYSLIVNDIDPNYTLGDMARRRREIMAQLEADGVLNLNKELPMPELPQRVAVVSSATAAGYGDFCDQLKNNPYGYVFIVELFQATMQGDQTERSVLAALDKINARSDEFDVVVIIRGGGATSDLSGFDTYMLAAACAQFSLPIITGIGHERDDTVLDMVAHSRVKTPTAAAELLIAHMVSAEARLTGLAERIKRGAEERMTMEKRRLDCRARIPAMVARRMAEERMRLSSADKDLRRAFAATMQTQRHKLELITQRLRDVSPERALAHGYTITMKNGKVVKNVGDLKTGDKIETLMRDGNITSIVE
jgi:exodeoxyribonuclease VII large subunit